MRYSGDHKAETRARLVREAARAIRAKGPDGVGVAGVMKRLGLTHGGFYAHFPSKDALIAAATEAMFASARRRSAGLEEGDPRAALRAYLDFYLSPEHRDRRDVGCPLPALSGDFARTQGEARDRFSAGIAALTGRLARALARIDVDRPEREASAMLSQMVGAVALSRAATDAAQAELILANAKAALVSRYGLGEAA